MVKSITISILLVLFLVGVPEVAEACQPCSEKLTLQDTVDQADLVIVGRRTDYKPGEKKPEGINIQVLRVFKGDIEKYAVISAKTMYGACEYGIAMGGEMALVFLKKLQKPKRKWHSIVPHKYDYTSVSYGCAPKSLTVTDGRVRIGGADISLEILEEGHILIFPPKEEEYLDTDGVHEEEIIEDEEDR